MSGWVPEEGRDVQCLELELQVVLTLPNEH